MEHTLWIRQSVPCDKGGRIAKYIVIDLSVQIIAHVVCAAGPRTFQPAVRAVWAEIGARTLIIVATSR